MSELLNISPIDGRYASKTAQLRDYFSEFGLIKYRVKVEIEYFIALCETEIDGLADFNKGLFPQLRQIYQKFSTVDAQSIKDIEKTTNHDVKAVEYFIKGRFDELNISEYKEFIHFGLTSQDINNTAIPMALKDAVEHVYLPFLKTTLLPLFIDMVEAWKKIPMLAKTHGQPASPTLLGKEMAVFYERLKNQIQLLCDTPFDGKFGGATGNMNAHYFAFPDVDWHGFAQQFLKEKLGLQRQYPTTQIEHYDNLGQLFDAFKRINTILLDLSKDFWTYISMDYFKQSIKAGEVGSSAMPHKVNPIDFENAEGNLGLANQLFIHLSEKLPISRLQRDLTDSTVTRNIGLPLSYTMIALQSIVKGMGKLSVNEAKIKADLDDNWAVCAEAIQSYLRKIQYPAPYEALKKLTRTGERINKESILDFVENLDISEKDKAYLRNVSPHTYVGKFDFKP